MTHVPGDTALEDGQSRGAPAAPSDQQQQQQQHQHHQGQQLQGPRAASPAQQFLDSLCRKWERVTRYGFIHFKGPNGQQAQHQQQQHPTAQQQQHGFVTRSFVAEGEVDYGVRQLRARGLHSNSVVQHAQSGLHCLACHHPDRDDWEGAECSVEDADECSPLCPIHSLIRRAPEHRFVYEALPCLYRPVASCPDCQAVVQGDASPALGGTASAAWPLADPSTFRCELLAEAPDALQLEEGCPPDWQGEHPAAEGPLCDPSRPLSVSGSFIDPLASAPRDVLSFLATMGPNSSSAGTGGGGGGNAGSFIGGNPGERRAGPPSSSASCLVPSAAPTDHRNLLSFLESPPAPRPDIPDAPARATSEQAPPPQEAPQEDPARSASPVLEARPSQRQVIAAQRQAQLQHHHAHFLAHVKAEALHFSRQIQAMQGGALGPATPSPPSSPSAGGLAHLAPPPLACCCISYLEECGGPPLHHHHHAIPEEPHSLEASPALGPAHKPHPAADSGLRPPPCSQEFRLVGLGESGVGQEMLGAPSPCPPGSVCSPAKGDSASCIPPVSTAAPSPHRHLGPSSAAPSRGPLTPAAPAASPGHHQQHQHQQEEGDSSDGDDSLRELAEDDDDEPLHQGNPDAPVEWRLVTLPDGREVELPLGPDGQPLQSKGSALHHCGACKPCVFFHTKGCQNGPACPFCHEFHPKKKRFRKLTVEKMERLRQRLLQKPHCEWAQKVLQRQEALLRRQANGAPPTTPGPMPAVAGPYPPPPMSAAGPSPPYPVGPAEQPPLPLPPQQHRQHRFNPFRVLQDMVLGRGHEGHQAFPGPNHLPLNHAQNQQGQNQQGQQGQQGPARRQQQAAYPPMGAAMSAAAMPGQYGYPGGVDAHVHYAHQYAHQQQEFVPPPPGQQAANGHGQWGWAGRKGR